MLSLLFACVLASGVICSLEFIFILLSSGPFWIGPGLFLQTWLIYFLLVLIGSLLLHGVLSLIPFFRKRIQDSHRRFHIFFARAILAAGIVLLTLILKVRDLGAGLETRHYIYAASVFLGLVALIFVIRKFITKPIHISSRALIVSVAFVAITALVFLISDIRFGTAIKQRAASFTGRIPHLALIIWDTTRRDHLSGYGYPVETSPNLDKIAAEGLFCANAFSTTNWTPPGHISIFTGKYPSQFGNNGQPYMPENLVAITEIINQLGYYCVSLPNNRFAGKTINLTQGFDRDHWIWLDTWIYPGWMLIWNQLVYKDRGAKATFAIAADLFKYVDKKGGHLFLYINVLEPHLEYRIHEPFFSGFASSFRMADIPNMDEVQKFCDSRGVITYDSTFFTNYNEASYKYITAAYDSEIAYTDHYFGRFTNEMRETGLLDQTLLIVTADHGEFLGEHYSKDHPAMMYHPAIAVPLVMRYPALIEPRTVSSLTSVVDILPTTLKLMGLEDLIPTDVSGLNLLDQRVLIHRPILTENYNCLHISEPQGAVYSLFDGVHKLMLNTDPEFLEKFPFDTLLVDVQSDPDELIDFHAQYPSTTDSMMLYLNQWIESIRVVGEAQTTVDENLHQNLKALGYVN